MPLESGIRNPAAACYLAESHNLKIKIQLSSLNKFQTRTFGDTETSQGDALPESARVTPTYLYADMNNIKLDLVKNANVTFVQEQNFLLLQKRKKKGS